MSRILSPPLAAYFIGAILECMKREAVQKENRALVREIREIVQSLGIPREKIITRASFLLSFLVIPPRAPGAPAHAVDLIRLPLCRPGP